MKRTTTPVLISDLRGGRNKTDPPALMPETQCVEAMNVDWYLASFARKRPGTSTVSTTFSSGGPFTGIIGALMRFVPGAVETAAELWAIDNANIIGRLAGAATWVAPTSIAGTPSTWLEANGVSLGGLFFLAYQVSTSNRLKVWDSVLNEIRPVGLATPAAPTGADDAAGGLTLTRSYRVRWVEISGSDTRRMSEASAILTRSIAAKAGSTITRPTAAGEGETHWDLEASDATTGPWYRIARTVIGTTTFDDTSGTIATTNISPLDGIFYPPPSAKYLVATDARVLMAGAWETSGGYTTPKNNRVWYTPVIGDRDVGDSERIPSANRIDVDAAITGLGGPLQGSIYVFGYRRMWKLVPTGVDSDPYHKFDISSPVGCIAHSSIVMAEDETGSPALYFWSHVGPYRLGATGLQFLGLDIKDQIDAVNLGAANVVVHGQYHSSLHQVWWWIATGSANDPNVKVVFDTRLGRSGAAGAVRGGWSLANGTQTVSRCSCMFANTIGATMSRDLKPYVARAAMVSVIGKCDSSATDDYGDTYQAYIDTREYASPAGLDHDLASMEGFVVAKAASGVTISVTPTHGYGQQTITAGTVSLTPSGSETRLRRKMEGMQTADAPSVSYRVGDAAAVSNGWQIDLVVFEHQDGGAA
jgi:hypothetical protein